MKEDTRTNTLNWILGGALVIALIVIAFLLGRDSRGDRVVYESSPKAKKTGMRIEQVGDDLVITNVDSIERTESDERPRSPSDSKSSPPSDSGAVSDYFAAVDAVQSGPAGTSPEAFAQSLAADIGSGNTSGIKKLEADLKRSEEDLKAISPPPECAAYHRELLSSVSDGRQMLRDLSKALSGGNPSAAASLASKANQLKQTQNRLEKMRKALENG